MHVILSVIGVLLLTVFSWIALYILVFTVSLAWHRGAQKTQEKENRKLKKLAIEITQFLEGVKSQEKPPIVN